MGVLTLSEQADIVLLHSQLSGDAERDENDRFSQVSGVSQDRLVRVGPSKHIIGHKVTERTVPSLCEKYGVDVNRGVAEAMV